MLSAIWCCHLGIEIIWYFLLVLLLWWWVLWFCCCLFFFLGSFVLVRFDCFWFSLLLLGFFWFCFLFLLCCFVFFNNQTSGLKFLRFCFCSGWHFLVLFQLEFSSLSAGYIETFFSHASTYSHTHSKVSVFELGSSDMQQNPTIWGICLYFQTHTQVNTHKQELQYLNHLSTSICVQFSCFFSFHPESFGELLQVLNYFEIIFISDGVEFWFCSPVGIWSRYFLPLSKKASKY